MNPTYDFHGQVAVVTGAGSGMGLATVQAFAEAGAAVVLADINEDALRAATDELTAAGHQALGVTCDVSDEDQVAALVERTVDDLRPARHGLQQRRHHDPAEPMPPTNRPSTSTASPRSTCAASGPA